MRRVWVAAILLLAAAGAGAALMSRRRPPAVPPAEHTGAFGLTTGSTLAFAARDDGCLRVVLSDGQVGRVCPESEGASAYSGASYFSGQGPQLIRAAFAEGAVEINWAAASGRRGIRLEGERRPLSFRSSDALELIGELVLPPGEGSVPVVVHVGGSEKSGSVGRVWMPYMLASRGVASFVYDKRGVGGSEGSYSQDFHQLASDAAAAIDAAREAMGPRLGAMGVVGFSQGGWVGPFAARKAEVDAVIVAFGLAVSPLEEEVSEVRARIAAAGHNAATIDRAGELAAAAARLADTDFAEGSEAFDRLKAAAEQEGWLADVGSEGITGALAQNPVFFVRSLWSFFDVNTSWRFDPKATLAALEAPQLWLLGGRDRDAPSQATQSVLAELAAGGADIEVVVYESADHGLIERVGGPDGPASRYVEGYWQRVAEFMLTAQARLTR